MLFLNIYLFIYLKAELQTVRKGWQKRDLPSAESHPKWTQQPGLYQAQTRSQELSTSVRPDRAQALRPSSAIFSSSSVGR